jgi:hypothetical protein
MLHIKREPNVPHHFQQQSICQDGTRIICSSISPKHFRLGGSDTSHRVLAKNVCDINIRPPECPSPQYQCTARPPHTLCFEKCLSFNMHSSLSSSVSALVADRRGQYCKSIEIESPEFSDVVPHKPLERSSGHVIPQEIASPCDTKVPNMWYQLLQVTELDHHTNSRPGLNSLVLDPPPHLGESVWQVVVYQAPAPWITSERVQGNDLNVRRIATSGRISVSHAKFCHRSVVGLQTGHSARS